MGLSSVLYEENSGYSGMGLSPHLVGTADQCRQAKKLKRNMHKIQVKIRLKYELTNTNKPNNGVSTF